MRLPISPANRLEHAAEFDEEFDDQLLNVKDAAPILNVTPSWVYEHTRDGCDDILPAIKIGKYLRFDRRDLQAYIDTRRTTTRELWTQHGYKNVLRKHLLPYWCEWRLRDVGRLHVQQWGRQVPAT